MTAPLLEDMIICGFVFPSLSWKPFKSLAFIHLMLNHDTPLESIPSLLANTSQIVGLRLEGDDLFDQVTLVESLQLYPLKASIVCLPQCREVQISGFLAHEAVYLFSAVEFPAVDALYVQCRAEVLSDDTVLTQLSGLPPSVIALCRSKDTVTFVNTDEQITLSVPHADANECARTLALSTRVALHVEVLLNLPDRWDRSCRVNVLNAPRDVLGMNVKHVEMYDACHPMRRLPEETSWKTVLMGSFATATLAVGYEQDTEDRMSGAEPPGSSS